MALLFCKVYPKDSKTTIPNILPKNKVISEPTEVNLSEAEFKRCKAYGKITICNDKFDVTTLTFADAVDLYDKNKSEAKMNTSEHNQVKDKNDKTFVINETKKEDKRAMKKDHSIKTETKDETKEEQNNKSPFIIHKKSEVSTPVKEVEKTESLEENTDSKNNEQKDNSVIVDQISSTRTNSYNGKNKNSK